MLDGVLSDRTSFKDRTEKIRTGQDRIGRDITPNRFRG